MLEQLYSYSEDLYYVDFCPGWSYSNQEIEAVFPKEKIRFLEENFTRNDIKNDFIVVTGSLYFIGKIRAHITDSFE